VGIYIAAIQDTMDRKQQQLSNNTEQKPSGDGGNISSGHQQTAFIPTLLRRLP